MQQSIIKGEWMKIQTFKTAFYYFSIGKINCKIDKINCKIDKINWKIGKINCKIDKINCKIGKINCKIDKINGRFKCYLCTSQLLQFLLLSINKINPLVSYIKFKTFFCRSLCILQTSKRSNRSGLLFNKDLVPKRMK